MASEAANTMRRADCPAAFDAARRPKRHLLLRTRATASPWSALRKPRPSRQTCLTGLWPSERTHAWDSFATEDHAQHIVSPQGGHALLEPRALKWPLPDASARVWRKGPTRMVLLEDKGRARQMLTDRDRNRRLRGLFPAAG